MNKKSNFFLWIGVEIEPHGHFGFLARSTDQSSSSLVVAEHCSVSDWLMGEKPLFAQSLLNWWHSRFIIRQIPPSVFYFALCFSLFGQQRSYVYWMMSMCRLFVLNFLIKKNTCANQINRYPQKRLCLTWTAIVRMHLLGYIMVTLFRSKWNKFIVDDSKNDSIYSINLLYCCSL